MVKRIISSILACMFGIMCCIIVFADSVEVVKKEISAPQKTLFIGDSIAAGFGLEGYTGDGSDPPSSYASILSQKYKKELDGICSATVINAAVSGDTSSQLLEKLKSGELDKHIFGSDVVVISIGGNDIMQPALEFLSQDLQITNQQDLESYDTSKLANPSIIAMLNNRIEAINQNLDAFSVNLSQIISDIKSKTSGTIIIQTVYNPLDSTKEYEVISKLIGEKLSKLNNIISDNSKYENGQVNYLVCDVFSAFKGKSKQYTNIDKYDIHPNAEGHKVISELVDELIKQKKYSYEELVEVKDTPKAKLSTGKIYLTISLFFGVFLVLYLVVWVVFKKNQR